MVSLGGSVYYSFRASIPCDQIGPDREATGPRANFRSSLALWPRRVIPIEVRMIVHLNPVEIRSGSMRIGGCSTKNEPAPSGGCIDRRHPDPRRGRDRFGMTWPRGDFGDEPPRAGDTHPRGRAERTSVANRLSPVTARVTGIAWPSVLHPAQLSLCVISLRTRGNPDPEAKSGRLRVHTDPRGSARTLTAVRAFLRTPAPPPCLFRLRPS